MHYRNGRDAKNGDQIIQLDGGKIVAVGVLYNAAPGNDYCNGEIVTTLPQHAVACLCDCLHIDDLTVALRARGLDKRPAGM